MKGFEALSGMEREGKHVLSHAAIYLAARGLPGIVAFLAIPVFTRLLDPGDYGRYALVVATVTMLNALLFQWLRLSLVRYMPAFKDDPAKLKSTLAGTTGVLILGLGLLAGAACLFPIGMTWRLVLAACWLTLAVQALFELCCEYARSSLRPWQYMTLQLMRSSSAIVLGMTLILLGLGWWGPLIATAVGMALAVAWCYRRDWGDVRWRVDRATLKKICMYGVPLSLTVALANVISSTDRFLIAGFMGEDSAGLYSVAVDFTSQTLTLLMVVINMAVFPMAVRAWENHGRQAAQDQMRANASLLMVVGAPSVIGMAMLAPDVAYCFLGKSFRGAAAHIIPLVALGTFLANFKAFHFDAAFQFAHRTIYQVWIVLFVAVVNIALNLIAIPRWGINGAVGASVLAYAISIVLTAWFGRRHFSLPFPFGAAARVLLAGGIMAVALYPVRGYLGGLAMLGQVALGAAVYGAVLAVSNFMGLRQFILLKVRPASRPDVTGPMTTKSAAQLVEVQ